MQKNNIEYIAPYHDVMKYHPVPSRNGTLTHGVSFLNLEFILPHTLEDKNQMRIKTFLKNHLQIVFYCFHIVMFNSHKCFL